MLNSQAAQGRIVFALSLRRHYIIKLDPQAYVEDLGVNRPSFSTLNVGFKSASWKLEC